MPKRAYAYKWVGEMTIDGRPHKHIGNSDVKPEDLEPEYVEALSDQQIAKIHEHPDLYKPINKPASNKPASKKSVAGPEPKWFQALSKRIEIAGNEAPPRLKDESEAAYKARVPLQNLLTTNPTPAAPAQPPAIEPPAEN